MILYVNSAFAINQERNYLLLESSKKTSDGLRISSIGAFGFSDIMFAHLNLSYVNSDLNGKGAVADIGLGLSYKILGTFFAGGGYMMGYNPGKEEFIDAYYPEIGVAFEFSHKFGLIVSGKRLINLYDGNEDIILFGLLFNDK